MPWFRRKRKDDTQLGSAVAIAPAVEAPEPTELEHDSTAGTETPGETPEAPKRKRRRGSRGGKGRKKPSATTTTNTGDASAASTEAPAKAQTEPRKGGERKDKERERRPASRQGARRRQQQRRAPLPAAKRELLISVDVGEQRVAILEDDRVAEVYLERPERRSIAGNIYLGVVDNVLPGMEAAFVEIGLEKNGFLYVDEIVVPELEGKRHGKKIQDLISRGEQLLVQAVKDPMKTKGARLTTELSLPGRFLVYVPNGEGLGVSRRLDDAERQRLKDIIKDLDAKSGGIIVRTAAEGASAEDIERDLVFLQRLWNTIQARAKNATAPALVYQEAELPLRIVRDLFAGDFVSATIDHDRTFKRIVGYLKKTSPHMIDRVQRYKEKTPPLFEAHGVDREIQSTLDRRVDLPSGGYLIFDYAEAFTVVDVNTGRFVGSRSKTSSQRLEDTITKNNLEAVKEVVRQLRLRDIGGIIVIDFIDMANPKNRAQVEEALRTELERDRTKTYVVEISPLGLVEMTRQNVTDGPREILTRKCPVCEGDGIVVSDQTVAMQIERRLRGLAVSGSRVQAFRVAVHPRILPLVAGPGGARLAAIEDAAKRRFFLVPAESGHVHTDHLEVLAEGKLVDLQPVAPVAEGAELEVKLVELDLHDATAAVGKVDGFDVVVAGAGTLVGKKAKVVVGRVLDGQAFAALVVADTGEGPITFESEAEKPTRAPARRKPAAETADASLTAEDEIGDEEEDDEETETELVIADYDDEDEEDDDEDELAADADSDAEPGATPAAKKRTRRGSRGGRRRKKKPAGAGVGETDGAAVETRPGSTDQPGQAIAPVETGVEAAVAEDAEPVVAAAAARRPAAKKPATPNAPAGARRTPKVHVPAADLEGSDAGGDAADGPAAAGDGTGDADGQVRPKPRTRRGSRGGRNRKRKAPVGETAANGAEPPGDGVAAVVEAQADEAAAHTETPAPEAPAQSRPARQPRARSAPATAPASAPPDVAAEGEPGYVPMSEWLDDFDR